MRKSLARGDGCNLECYPENCVLLCTFPLNVRILKIIEVEQCWEKEMCNTVDLQHWIGKHENKECQSLEWALGHYDLLPYTHLCECVISDDINPNEYPTCVYDFFEIDIQISGCGDIKFDRNIHFKKDFEFAYVSNMMLD